MIIAALQAVLSFLLFVHLVTICLVFWWRFTRAPKAAQAAVLPHITLLRPVCGLTDLERETLRSSFDLDYPDYQIIFCAARETDPVVTFVKELIAANPLANARLLIGDTPISMNPKLNNLQKGVDAAQGDWIVMADSNLSLPPDYLHRLLQCWHEGAGLVSAPPIGSRPENLWGAVECAFLNANQARWQIAAAAVGQGFAQGKTMLWRRDILETAGGLPALGRFMAEDVASTKAVRAQGLAVELPRVLFEQPIGLRSFRAVWDRQLRWSKVRRDGFFWIFAAEIAQGPMLAFGAAFALLIFGGLSVAAFAGVVVLWYGAEWGLSRLMGWPSSLRDVAGFLLRDALLPLIWLATWGSRDFVWHGTAMKPIAPELSSPEL